MIDKQCSNIILAHQFQFGYAIRSDHGDNIGVGLKSSPLHLQIIGNDHIQILLHQFLLGILQHIFGFHRESTKELAGLFVITQKFQNIVRALQRDAKFSIRFLDLFICNLGWTVIGNGSSLDDLWQK